MKNKKKLDQKKSNNIYLKEKKEGFVKFGKVKKITSFKSKFSKLIVPFRTPQNE